MMRIKRCFPMIATVLLAVITAQPVLASVNNEATYPVVTDEISEWPKSPEVFSDTAVLMDADSGQVLYNKGMDEPRYPASITKIMTALLALENASLDQEVKFTDEGVKNILEGTNIQAQPWEIMTMEQCLYALLIKSANEVADQIALTVGGTREEFVAMMNAKAKELGCTNTNFNNPSGLPDAQHYTTAHDMALIYREALKNEEFCKITQTLEYTIPPTNSTSTPRVFTSHHALLVPTAPEYYEGCLGGKTGVTDLSRNTLVTGVRREDTTYIAVVMRADAGQVCADSRALFDYGYQNFEKLTIKDTTLLVPKGVTEEDITVEAKKEDTAGVLDFSFNNSLIHSKPITLAEIEQLSESQVTPEETIEPTVTEEIVSENTESAGKIELNKQYRRIIIVLAGLIVFVLVMIIITAIVKNNKRKKRMRRY